MPKVRSALIAAAVALGFALAGGGVAYADVPAIGGGNGATCQNALPCEDSPATGTNDPPPPPPVDNDNVCGRGTHEHNDDDVCVAGHRWNPRIGHWYGATLYHRQLWLEANLAVDLCSYPDYDRLLVAYPRHRADILRLVHRDRFVSLRGACSGPGTVVSGDRAIVSNDGDCVTYVSDVRTFGLRYRGLFDGRDRALRLARSVHSDGGVLVTNRELRSIRLNDGVLHGVWNRYHLAADHVRTVCKQNPVVVVNDPPADVLRTAPVNINNTVNTAPASSSSNGNPVVTATSAGQVSSVPSGSVPAGDGS